MILNLAKMNREPAADLQFLVDLLRSYSNRADLLTRLIEARRPANRRGTSEQDDSGLTVPSRAVRTWRVRDRLTDDDVNQLIAEFLSGVSKRELADRYGISFGAVKDLLRRHGVRRT